MNNNDIKIINGSVIDLGTIPISEEAKNGENLKIIRLQNTSKRKINIIDYAASCTCVQVVGFSTYTMEPGDIVEIKLVMALRRSDSEGRREHLIVETDSAVNPKLKFSIVGKARFGHFLAPKKLRFVGGSTAESEQVFVLNTVDGVEIKEIQVPNKAFKLEARPYRNDAQPANSNKKSFYCIVRFSPQNLKEIKSFSGALTILLSDNTSMILPVEWQFL